MGNNLTKLPTEIKSLNYLETFNLSHNQFSSDDDASIFWEQLASFGSLNDLNLSDNFLRGIHTEKLIAGDFGNLENLDFRNNKVDDQMK